MSEWIKWVQPVLMSSGAQLQNQLSCWRGSGSYDTGTVDESYYSYLAFDGDPNTSINFAKWDSWQLYFCTLSPIKMSSITITGSLPSSGKLSYSDNGVDYVKAAEWSEGGASKTLALGANQAAHQYWLIDSGAVDGSISNIAITATKERLSPAMMLLDKRTATLYTNGQHIQPGAVATLETNSQKVTPFAVSIMEAERVDVKPFAVVTAAVESAQDQFFDIARSVTTTHLAHFDMSATSARVYTAEFDTSRELRPSNPPRKAQFDMVRNPVGTINLDSKRSVTKSSLIQFSTSRSIKRNLTLSVGYAETAIIDIGKPLLIGVGVFIEPEGYAEIRYSNDRNNMGNWVEYFPCEVTCRYVQIRIAVRGMVKSAKVTIDKREQTVRMTKTVPAGGDNIAYGVDFVNIPTVIANTVGEGLHAEIVSKDSHNCFIKVKKGDTDVGGSVDLSVAGI